MSNTNTSVLMAGFGWIGAGIVSFATWYMLSTKHIYTASNPSNMLYISILVAIVGISVLVFRKRINRIIEEKRATIALKQATAKKSSI